MFPVLNLCVCVAFVVGGFTPVCCYFLLLCLRGKKKKKSCMITCIISVYQSVKVMNLTACCDTGDNFSQLNYQSLSVTKVFPAKFALLVILFNFFCTIFKSLQSSSEACCHFTVLFFSPLNFCSTE